MLETDAGGRVVGRGTRLYPQGKDRIVLRATERRSQWDDRGVCGGTDPSPQREDRIVDSSGCAGDRYPQGRTR